MAEPLFWDGYVHIARYALPIVKELREKGVCYPVGFNSMEEWKAVLLQMEMALGVVAEAPVHEFDQSVKDGLEIFGKWFIHLYD